jgi:hypothetical protein
MTGATPPAAATEAVALMRMNARLSMDVSSRRFVEIKRSRGQLGSSQPYCYTGSCGLAAG